MMIVSAYVGIYYNVIIMYTLYYMLLHSLRCYHGSGVVNRGTRPYVLTLSKTVWARKES